VAVRQDPASRQRPLYNSPPPKPKGRAVLPRRPNITADQQVSPTEKYFPHAHPIAPTHFTLREDGSIQLTAETPRRREENENESGGRPQDLRVSASPRLIFSSDSPFVRLYHGNCLELLDAIFADPPYFLPAGP